MGQVFRRFDKEGLGAIGVSELAEALTALGLPSDGPAAAEVLRRFDADASGKLELGEFRSLCKELKKAGHASGVVEDGAPAAASAAPTAAATAAPKVVRSKDIAAIFRRHDADGSGDIDVGELRVALNELGVQADTAAAADLLQRFDADSSGRLDMDEFRKLVLKVQQFQDAEPTHGD